MQKKIITGEPAICGLQNNIGEKKIIFGQHIQKHWEKLYHRHFFYWFAAGKILDHFDQDTFVGTVRKSKKILPAVMQPDKGRNIINQLLIYVGSRMKKAYEYDNI